MPEITSFITGFTYCGYCNCTGTRNNKYSKGEYIVYYQPKRKVYHLKYLNNYILKNEPIATLCQKLKSLGLTDLEDCLELN